MAINPELYKKEGKFFSMKIKHWIITDDKNGPVRRRTGRGKEKWNIRFLNLEGKSEAAPTLAVPPIVTRACPAQPHGRAGHKAVWRHFGATRQPPLGSSPPIDLFIIAFQRSRPLMQTRAASTSECLLGDRSSKQAAQAGQPQGGLIKCSRLVRKQLCFTAHTNSITQSRLLAPGFLQLRVQCFQ